jgi:hypothetical protein
VSALAAASSFTPALAPVRADDRPWPPEPHYAPHRVTQGQLRLRAMECAFLPTGGIVSGDCFSQLLRHGQDQPISTLARWIVNRDVVSFEVHGQIWLPMFQFDPSDLHVRPGVKKVIDELRGVFDDWELAEWFAHPNSSLAGQTPASEVVCNEQAVLEAARVDRFVAAG